MTLFIDIVRRFTTKKLSQYLKQIEKKIFKEFSDRIPEAIDDDLRGLGALSTERIGHADNLTEGHIQSKSQTCKTIYEGGRNELVLWLYGNDVNSAQWKDRSEWEGVREKGIDFDGVDDKIDLGNESTLWSQSKTKFSFSIWVYFDSTNTGTGNRDIVRHDGTSNHRFVLELSGSNLSFNIKNSVGSVLSATTALSGIATKKWHLLTCVYDNSLGTENLKLYVDAVKLGTANLTEAINLSGNINIGGSGVQLSLDGKVMDFRWWTTKALSQTEIDGLLVLSPLPTPDYWLPMTEGTGNPVDKISKTKTGVLTNGADWNARNHSKKIQSIGNPCVVKTTQSFIGRKEVGYFNGIGDGGRIEHDTDMVLDEEGVGISMSGWFYIPTGADAIYDGYLNQNTVFFDGINDFVDLGNHASLWSQSLTKFSFCFWIRPTAGWDGNDRYVVNHGGTANHAFRCIIDQAVANRIRFLIKDSLGSIFTATNDTLQLNAWNFVTCVYDNSLGSANLKIYVNAVAGTPPSTLTEAINLSATLTLADDNGNDFQGNLKDFQFFVNRALTQTEITNIMNGDEYLNGFHPNCRFAFNEGIDIAEDMFEDARDASFSGAVWQVSTTYTHKIKLPRPIYVKIDNDSDYNILFLMPQNKSLVWLVKENGTVRVRQIDNAYAYDTWVYWAVKYDPITPTFTFYKDGSVVSNSTPTHIFPTVPQGADRTDAFLFYGGDMNDVFTNIAFYNLKYWRDKLLTNTEVSNENTNKFTISNIALAERPIVGYATINT